MRDAIRRASAVVAACAVACTAPDALPPTEGVGGSCPEREPSASGGAAEDGAAPCECAAAAMPLRVVRVVDSRALEPNTVVMAASPDPQTLWLPDAAGDIGSFVVVKEARGDARRVTVIALGDGDSFIEYDATAAHSSRTFVAANDSAGAPAWVILDVVDQ